MPAYGNTIGMDKGYDCDAAVSKGRAVKGGAAVESVAPISAVTDRVRGISLFNVTVDEIARGKGCSVRMGGIAEWECGGVIAKDDDVTIDSVGRCVSATGETPATLNTVGAANGNLTWTAKKVGAAGNALTITIVDPAGNNVPLSVDVANNGNDIIVTSATDGASAITSTAQDVINAVEANGDANDLVNVVNTGASTGAGLVLAVAKTNLAAGAGTAGAKVYGTALQAGVLGQFIAVEVQFPGIPIAA